MSGTRLRRSPFVVGILLGTMLAAGALYFYAGVSRDPAWRPGDPNGCAGQTAFDTAVERLLPELRTRAGMTEQDARAAAVAAAEAAAQQAGTPFCLGVERNPLPRL